MSLINENDINYDVKIYK